MHLPVQVPQSASYRLSRDITMASCEAFEPILNRIEKGQQTEEDLAVLRQLLEAENHQIAKQLGKYNVHIERGRDIQIGDRLYLEWNDEAIQKLVEVIQDPFNSIPLLPQELPQTEYLRLKSLLASGKWLEANFTSRTIILKAVNAETEGWVPDKQIQNFPCQVLQAIDRLWLKYSEGRFGFSVQKRIFNECQKDPLLFADRLGWRVRNTWISVSQVSFSLTNSPEGHLPWGVMQVITIDNLALYAFVSGFRAIMKTTMQQDWQRQLFADYMGFFGSFLGEKFDKEEVKKNLEYELSHDEAWWEGQRLEELKVRKLFSLLAACPNL